MNFIYYVIVACSPIGIFTSLGFVIMRLSNRKNANVITGKIVNNRFSYYKRYPKAVIQLTEGPNRGEQFVDTSMVSMFGHEIGKKIKVLEFEYKGEYDYFVAYTYVSKPIIWFVFFTLVLILSLMYGLS